MKQKHETLKARRENSLYINSLILHGNGKLLDYIDDDGNAHNYAQFNTRAIKDCPFRSKGCERVCYATKGNHVFPSVQESREKSYNDSRRDDFAECMIWTIETEKKSKRYMNAEMIIRVHESGDFYSVQYLRKWVKVWERFTDNDGVTFVLYTKSFPFFLMLNEKEKDIIRSAMRKSVLSINLSIDDTTTPEQRSLYLQMMKEFPLCNTYIVTEHTDGIDDDDVCRCENCAECGACNKAQAGRKYVKIHSASNADIEDYRKNAQK